jgi:hypothetical protein
VAIVNNDDLRKLRGDITAKGKGNTETREAAVVTAAEIARMKASAVVISDKEAAERKRINEEQKAQ